MDVSKHIEAKVPKFQSFTQKMKWVNKMGDEIDEVVETKGE